MDECTGERLVLRLYVAGGAMISLRAADNLRKIERGYFGERCQIEIIDVFEAPDRALQDGVLVTPTLLKIAPAPAVRIVGDLSAIERVVSVLDGADLMFVKESETKSES